MLHLLRRFYFAHNGIMHAIRTDLSFRTQLIGGTIFLPIFVYFVWPLTETEALFLGLAFILVLVTELQNSSFEAALDHLHPERHDDIGQSKDMAAGGVLLAGFFALFVVVTIVLVRVF